MVASGEEKLTMEGIQNAFFTLKQASLKSRVEPIKNRERRLQILRNWIKSNRIAIQEAIYQDFGKPAAEVDATEIFPALSEIKHAISNLERWVKPKKVDAPLTLLGTRSVISYEPRGLCLIISPWNYPFNLSLGPLVSALAAGNNVILKPSEITPNTSALIAKMCKEIFTAIEVIVVQGGPEVSQELLKLPFDHIFFTGSPAIGKVVMKAAAENLTSVTLELGGKSPTIVSASANLKEAARRIAMAKFLNSGQTCIAPDYVLVQQSIEDDFIGSLKEQIQKLFTDRGKTIFESPYYARIVSEKHFIRLNSIIQDALTKGAAIEVGGPLDQTHRFIHPMVLSQVSAESRVMQEEIFGPILPILSFQTLDEVIAIINEKPKPLALYYFGTSRSEQSRIKRETSSGAICFNDSAIQFLNHNLPFGGVNNSGIGKSHGYYGFLSFSNEKPIIKQRSGLTSVQFFYPPYTPLIKRLISGLLKFY